MLPFFFFRPSGYRTFKAYYTQYVTVHLRTEVPALVSYTRFIDLIPSVLVLLCAYLETCRGAGRGLSFIDSTTLAVCHNRRIQRHRVFAGLAGRGKNSVGWFYGFNLHLVVNDQDETNEAIPG